MAHKFELTLAQDDLIAQVQASVIRVMEEKGVSQVELAQRMGVSEARVSNLLDSNRPKNLTLRVIANLFHCMGEEPEITSSTVQALNAAAEKRKIGKMRAAQQRRKADWFITVPKVAFEPCNDTEPADAYTYNGQRAYA